MTLRIATLAGVLALLPATPAVAAQAPDTEGAAVQTEAISAARASAKEWLALLDAWDWTGTWEQAGELMRGVVDQRRWERQMSVTLGPLGKVRSRAARSSEHSTTMPGAPDGEYVVLQFDTTFENKQTALENVVMKKQPDGSWKVEGYRIK